MKLYDGGRAPNPRRVRVYLAEKGLTVPLMTKIRTARVTLATRTVIPTRSCDHLTCCWLGTGPPSWN